MAERPQRILSSGPDIYADDGYAAWLRYERLPETSHVPTRVVAFGTSALLDSAVRELRYAIQRLSGSTPTLARTVQVGDLVIGTVADLASAGIASDPEGLEPEGFRIHEAEQTFVTGLDYRGVLYGCFEYLRRLQLGLHPSCQENPSAPIRYLNHWDNPGGTIERGYAGRSLFFSDNPDGDGLVTRDLARVSDYARLVASIGINGCSLNNVNSEDRVYSAEGLPYMALLADAMRPYGVQTLLSISLDSPMRLGELESFDPLDEHVTQWWNEKVNEIYRYIPDLAGLIVKADSEGRKGPSAYGRTHADAANMIARALAPFHGDVFYRGFVYDHHMNWRDLSNDRARAAYDNFKALDGQFEANAIVQIKNGPIDFQVREPVSPCFAALENTSTVLELMITQEYLGQQHHTVYEAPWWKDTLDFDFQLPNRPSTVADIVTGETFKPARHGFVAVCGVGRDRNWLGNHLAQANLYAYGRLAWNPHLSTEAIADEWIAQTFSRKPEVRREIGHILMRSWPVYENYTGNLGIGGLTDIIHIHYGPAPLSSEHNGWGQWHRSTETGTGMNRTAATGTGFVAQYPEAAAERFESLESCPEELLLFFHHVPYTHRLRSGKTVIQHIYDCHYEGAAEVNDFVARWKGLQGKVDTHRYGQVLAQLEYQAGHARVWRDAICNWFCKLSGIEDDLARVFNAPRRVEAESMELDGYEIVDIEPWEAASGGKSIRLPEGCGIGAASFVVQTTGTYDIVTSYFDPRGGQSTFELCLENRTVDSWQANREFPTDTLDSHSRTLRTTRRVELSVGDRITLRGFRDGADPAGLDYIDLVPYGETA